MKKNKNSDCVESYSYKLKSKTNAPNSELKFI